MVCALSCLWDDKLEDTKIDNKIDVKSQEYFWL
jgi:hypothetical protein